MPTLVFPEFKVFSFGIATALAAQALKPMSGDADKNMQVIVDRFVQTATALRMHNGKLSIAGGARAVQGELETGLLCSRPSSSNCPDGPWVPPKPR